MGSKVIKIIIILFVFAGIIVGVKYLSEHDIIGGAAIFGSGHSVAGRESNMRLTLKTPYRDLIIALDNSEAGKALYEKVKEVGEITLEAEDYGNFEKVANLDFKLPAQDQTLNAKPGDVMLYQADKIVFFYGENRFGYTRLGYIVDSSADEIRDALAGKEITLTLSHR